MTEGEKYRPGVVAVIIDDQGQVLLCERSNARGAWQFPQGGIEDGEDARVAVLREVSEELGCGRVEILATSAEWIAYDFPPEANFPLAKTFKGQTQLWFLAKFIGTDLPNLALSDGEFVDWRWMPIGSALEAVIAWKKGAYGLGLKMLGLI